MEAERAVPVLWQVVLDTTNARVLAEFHRQLLGFADRHRVTVVARHRLDA